MNTALVIHDQNLSVLLKKHIAQLPSANLVLDASSCETILDENALQHADLLFLETTTINNDSCGGPRKARTVPPHLTRPA